MSFDERIDEILSLSAAMKLNVLIWGPGKSATQQYIKREKMRQQIKNAFINADVRFSEDLVEAASGRTKDLTIPEQELFHFAACDICFVLDGKDEEYEHCHLVDRVVSRVRLLAIGKLGRLFL